MLHSASTEKSDARDDRHSRQSSRRARANAAHGAARQASFGAQRKRNTHSRNRMPNSFGESRIAFERGEAESTAGEAEQRAALRARHMRGLNRACTRIATPHARERQRQARCVRRDALPSAPARIHARPAANRLAIRTNAIPTETKAPPRIGISNTPEKEKVHRGIPGNAARILRKKYSSSRYP
ncbi:hypothetical protein X946_5310 [Burkholderia sp. ABCPW 111]|nr:hypothetical protein X946_5310 [Burkholderia sp. ABCPW 111]